MIERERKEGVRSLEIVLEGGEQHFDGFSEFRSGGWKNNFGYEVEWLNGKPSKEFSETKHLIYSGLVNFQPTSTTLTLQAKDFTISTKPQKLYTLLLSNYKVSNPSSNPYNPKCYPHTLIKKKRIKRYVKMITS